MVCVKPQAGGGGGDADIYGRPRVGGREGRYGCVAEPCNASLVRVRTAGGGSEEMGADRWQREGRHGGKGGPRAL